MPVRPGGEPSPVINLTEARVGHYVGRIRHAWQRQVDSIIETGRLLIEAKRELPGGFQAMIEEQLPFGARAAQMLMKIAGNPVLADAQYVSHLPPSWGTLYELTQLPQDLLREWILDGTIHPQLERKEVAMLNRPAQTHELAAAPADPSDTKPRVYVPGGKTVADLCREAALLQAQGATPKEAAEMVDISDRTYREGWTIVQLAERADLGERDAELARSALAEMNETRRTHKPFLRIIPLADRIWGKKAQRDDASRQRRIEEFRHAVTFLAETCARAGDINIPHLPAEDITAAVKQIGEAIASLRQLIKRIKE